MNPEPLPAPRHCAIAGATGLVGDRLLRLLLADATIGEIVVVGRRPPTLAKDTAASRLKCLLPVPGADPLSVFASPLPRVDTVFCALGTTINQAGSRENFRRLDHDAVLDFARAARQAGARRCIVVTAMGADPHSLIFYNRVKGEAELALDALGFEALHILRPSLLVGERERPRLGETVAAWAMDWLRPVVPARYRAIPAAYVAAAMARLAKSEDRGMYIHTSDCLWPDTVFNPA